MKRNRPEDINISEYMRDELEDEMKVYLRSYGCSEEGWKGIEFLRHLLICKGRHIVSRIRIF